MGPDGGAPPQLIALDIDGTILCHPRPPSQRVLTVIRNAVDSGAHVVLATGRTVLATLPVVRELGLTSGHVVCSNGAVRVDAGSAAIVEAHRFDAAPSVEYLRTLLPGAIFAAERVGAAALATGRFPVDGMILSDQLVDEATLVAEPTTRLTVWWDGHTAEELTGRLATAGVNGAHWTTDGAGPWLIAVAAGVSKGAMLERLRVELGVPAELTLAVGDAGNDIEMLRWAARGVAMGSASSLVRAVANEVTGTVADDGVASVLERWFE